MSERVSFSIWQDGSKMASVEGRSAIALIDAGHYARVYEQDGPVIVKCGSKVIYTTPKPSELPEPPNE